jgi:hypothetical protein
MTKLEKLAVALYWHLWQYIGESDDWPIQVCGDDDEITELIRLLNEVQDELKLRGYANRIGAVKMYEELKNAIN